VDPRWREAGGPDQGRPHRPRARHDRRGPGLKARLEANPVTLAVKAGAEGRLFGSVKTGDIADAVAAAGLGPVDKRLIELVAPIKGLGKHEAILKLRDGIVATITVSVVAAK